MMQILDPIQFIGLMSISALVCGALILGYPWLTARTRDRNDLASVQCAHVNPTPRVGGLGVLVATLIALLLLAPDEMRPFFSMFSLTLVPVFVAGLAEDLGWRVSAAGRLVAAALSAVAAIALLKVWIPPSGLPMLDIILAVTPLAMVITVIWATGVCHSLNLIDGVNGLAGAMGVLIAAGLSMVAFEAGAESFAVVTAALIPALFGFLIYNWPLGRIFLGDAGAYTLGHVLVWLAIGLAWHTSEVSAVALSLMFFWPVADTFLAIGRRMSSGRSIGAPDRLHYHQLVMRALLLLTHGRIGKGGANSATTVIMLPFIAAPVGAGVLFWNQPYAAALAWLGFAALFVGSYLAGIVLFRGSRWRKIARQVQYRAELRQERVLARNS
ncbi:MAG: hypothetical protein EA339_05775 [Rhodobacteraceae bacterium]|nr:MAG: hypothetical protein EA339_05775 [Paracoccaceae bacterium]